MTAPGRDPADDDPSFSGGFEAFLDMDIPEAHYLAHAIRDVIRRYDRMSSLEQFHGQMVPVLIRAVIELEERLIAVERRLEAH